MDFHGGNGGGSSKARYGEVEVRRRPAAAASPYSSDGGPAARVQRERNTPAAVGCLRRRLEYWATGRSGAPGCGLRLSDAPG